MHYVKNKDLRIQLIISKQQNKLTDKALDMFIMIVDRFSHNFMYLDNDDRKDCSQQALMDMFMFWDRYDASISSNAFAYMSQICKNGNAKGYNMIHKKRFRGKQISLSHGNIHSM